MNGGADISEDGKYRYRLWREWGSNGRLPWIMLNPSTADATVDDATIRKCIGFAKRWGYGGIEVVNLFALRATDPKVCRAAFDWGGERNDRAIISAVAGVGVVCAWGNFPWASARAKIVLTLVRDAASEVVCLGYSANGSPYHPLMQPYSRKCMEFSDQQTAQKLAARKAAAR